MRREYVFGLHSTVRQQVALAKCVEPHRELYNVALQERRDAWSHSKTHIGYGDQSAQLTGIRAARPDVAVWSFSSRQAIKRPGRCWMMVLSCDDLRGNPLPTTGRQAGIDVGVVSFATTSDGEHVDNPRWGRAAADKLAAAQRRWQRAKRPSQNCEGKRETVAGRQPKIANQRKDFHHKQARELAARYDLLVGDLQIANMLRRAKPVPPAPDSPGQFLPNGPRAKSGLNISRAAGVSTSRAESSRRRNTEG